jgi:6-phosphogluconolactonase (cycloisomerase 2 family)
VPGSIIPDTNLAYDLGNATKRFRDIYLSSNTINLGGAAVSVSGSGQLLVNGNNAATTFEYFGGEGFGPKDASTLIWETATGVSTFRALLPGALLKLALYDLKVGDKIKISNIPTTGYFELILTVSRVAYDIQIGGNPYIVLGIAESTPSIRIAYQLYLPVRDRTTSIVNQDKIVALSTSGILTVPGSIIPDANIAYDLGSPTNRFRDLYLSTSTIYLGNNLLSFDSSGQLATAQSYTGEEGVGGIYLISWDTGYVLRSTTSVTGDFVAIFQSLKTGDKFNISIYQNGRFETVVLTVTGTVQRSGPNPNYDFTIPVDISPPSTIVVESFNITKVPTSSNAVQNTATSTSTNTGALTVAGGVGIGGRLYVGDIINAGQTIRTDRFIQSPYQLIAPRGLVYRGTGALSTITTAVVTSSPINIAVDPTGRFAYVLNQTDDTVSQYSINANTGVLTPITPATTATGRGPNSIAVDPTGRFVYIVNNTANTISQYIINQSTGALSTTTNAISSGLDPQDVVVDATGRFVYVANGINGAIGQYSINASTGALTLIGTIAVAAGAFPYSICTDPTGRFVYVLNTTSTIGQYSINASTGILTLIGTIAVTTIPASMVADPTGRFVYVTGSANGTIRQYSINQNTGALTFVGTVATGSYPQEIAIDPTGRFVYVANNGAGTVSQYLINQNTGALSTITTAIAASSSPTAVAIDPTGRFVYVTDQANAAVSQYSINNFSAGSSVIAGKLFVSGLSNTTSSYIAYINTSTGELSYGVNSGSAGSIGSPYSGIFTITNTASSISTTTGALQVRGGVGVGGNLYVGGTIYSGGYAISTSTGGVATSSNGTTTTFIISNTTVSTGTNSGALQVVGGVGVGGVIVATEHHTPTGLANKPSNLYDISGSYIHAQNMLNIGRSGGGTISFGDGNTPAMILASPGSSGYIRAYINNDASNNQLWYGNSSGLIIGNGTSPNAKLDIRGNTVITSTATSTSTTTGALVVTGGVGIGGGLYVGGTVTATNFILNGNRVSTINPRVSSTSSITSPLVWNSDNFDQYAVTTQTNALTINADSGTPTDGQKMIFRFKDDGTGRVLTWTTGSSKSFRAIGVTLPTTTVASKTVYVGCVYNTDAVRWDAIAVSQEV